MSRVVAIFDVDQTLVQGYTERLFFRYLVRRRRLSLPRALAYLGQVACRLRDRFQDKSYLEGLPVEEVVGLARKCYREDIAPRVSPAGLACVLEHQAQGHAIALLSGSLSLLLAPLQEELGADWLIATELQRQNGQFTGAIAGLHPRGPINCGCFRSCPGRMALIYPRLTPMGTISRIPIFSVPSGIRWRSTLPGA